MMVAVPGYADLHVHTTASDGTKTPAQVVELALAAGLAALGIADHDTIEGVGAAQARADGTGLEIVPAVEINSEWRERDVHILGYWIDTNHDELNAALSHLRSSRDRRVGRMIRRLREFNFPLDEARVREIAGTGAIGRPHIARAMVERGYVRSVREAFDRYLAPGMPGYVPRERIEPSETVDLIKRAGGVAVLAHPGALRSDALLERLLELDFDGLEVYHPSHDSPTVARYLSLCTERGLLVTGGSDFHGGTEGEEEAMLGTVTVDVVRVAALRGAACRRKEGLIREEEAHEGSG